MTLFSKRPFAAMALLATTWLAACGGGGDTPAGPDLNAVASVALDQSSVALGAIGATQQLTATARNSAGTALSGKTFNFATSAANVATVSLAGLVTSVGNGTATITATLAGGTLSASAQVTVAQLVAAMTLTPATSTVTIGGTQQLTVAATDARGVAVASPTVSYTSSAIAVASVSTSGLVTALTAGATTITAAVGSISRSASITVVLPDLVLTRDTSLSGARSFRNITIPANVTVTATAPLTLRASGPISIAGTVLGSCIAVDIGSDTALTVTGRINNGCAAGTGGDLRLAATGELTLTNATITSSGDITLTNNPALTENSFLVAGALAHSALLPRTFSFAARPGGVPLARLDNSTVSYFGGGTGPNPATNGTNGVNGGNGADGRSVKMLLDGNAVFAGATVLWGQDGGNGGTGTNSSNTNLTVTGGNGGNGGLIKVYITGSLTYSGVTANTVRSGRGGTGGAANATTMANPIPDVAPSATATGGNGGVPGLVDMRAGNGIVINGGALTLEVPVGGVGGAATATAANGVDALVKDASSAAQPGGASTARGGTGGDTPDARLSASNVTGAPILSVPGAGAGGVATAASGKGGNGVKPRKDGAIGGATAVNGGTGGTSRIRNLANVVVGAGGNGGSGVWRLGNGGTGWNDCVPNNLELGGNGGAGGSAGGARGTAGNGAPIGTAGTTRFETVGNGGNGGSGAGPGAGGAAGTNAVVGPIGSQVAPNFTAGVAGVNCTPPPPPPDNLTPALNGILHTGGVVATGIQTVNLLSGSIVRGAMSVQFNAPTFVGSNPDRVGIGVGGKVTLKTSTAQADGQLYAVKYVRFCLINAPGVTAMNPVTVRELGIGVNNVLRTTQLTTPNACFERNTDSAMTDLEIAGAQFGSIDIWDFIISILQRA